MKEIPITSVIVEYECDKCGSKESTTIDEVADSGAPLCFGCDTNPIMFFSRVLLDEDELIKVENNG